MRALGWTLFHLIWEGSAVALALAVLLCFVRRSRARYGAACAALVTVLTGFIVTFIRMAGEDRMMLSGAPVWPPPAPDAAWRAFGALATPAPAASLAAWAAYFWIAGVAIFYLRATGGWISARRWRKTGVCTPAAIWQTRFATLTAKLGVTRPVILLQSSLADVPVVIGWIKPVILMPVGLLAGLPADQVEYILIHELAHVMRHDYLVNLLQTLAEGFLFYHPAVWWISGVIRTERENCCDDVVAINGDARAYAAALAALEESRQAEPAMAATGGNLMKRIRRLLNQQTLKQPEGPRAALTPLIAVGLIMVSVGLAFAYQAKQIPGKPVVVLAPVPLPATVPTVAAPRPKAPVVLLAQTRPDAPQDSLESAYRKWMLEDVAYIITDEERSAYMRLASNPEREHFIMQFWQIRNPVPGAEPNPFKEEHYRRIAYTNQHFVGQIPGWKTDRGRIYITFGPPDEIDSHPSGGAYTRPPEQGGGDTTVQPFEMWRYRFIQGIGRDVTMEFVGPEYRMTMDPHEKETIKKPGN